MQLKWALHGMQSVGACLGQCVAQEVPLRELHSQAQHFTMRLVPAHVMPDSEVTQDCTHAQHTLLHTADYITAGLASFTFRFWICHCHLCA